MIILKLGRVSIAVAPSRKRFGTLLMKRLRRIIWRKKYVTKGEKNCQNKHVDDKVLYQAFIKKFNTILENKDYFMQRWRQKKNSGDFLQKYKAQQFMELIAGGKPITEFDIDL